MTDDETRVGTAAAAPPLDPPPPPPGTGGPGGSSPGPAREPLRIGDAVRMALRGLGQLLITAGVVVLLFVVYEVYVTNWFAHQQQVKVHEALEQQWAEGELALPQGTLAAASGHGLANLYIPRFGKDYVWTIVQGHDPIVDSDLEKGPAHYTQSQLPGQKGDFAIAGHRVGKGEPFLNLDKLHAGDPVIVETGTRWYVYCVIGAGPEHDSCDPRAAGASLANTYADPTGAKVPGREVVDPSDGAVVLPVPGDRDVPAARAVTRYLTMTTCTPKFTAAQRMIVHAVLGETIRKTSLPGGRYDNTPPAQIEAMYGRAGG